MRIGILDFNKRGRAAFALTLALAGGYVAQAADLRAQVGDVKLVQNSAQAVFQKNSRPLLTAAPVLFEDMLKTGTDAS
jgi:hypothetical protein